ncbi:MAG: hypothetical protein WD042_01150 [Phycisphaeraceae bacterium]
MTRDKAGLWGVAIAALLLLAVGYAGQARADVESSYRAVWAQREKAATTPQTQVKLAADLLKDARRASDKAEKLYLLDRCYYWGSRTRDGYPDAATALGLIQDIDSSRRIDCLEKLLPLYQKAYEADKNRMLGLGVGYVDVRLQLARELTRKVNQQSASADVTPDQYAPELANIVNHYRMARVTTLEVLGKVNSYIARLQGVATDKAQQQRQDLADFKVGLDELPTKIDDRMAGVADLTKVAKEYSQYAQVLEKVPTNGKIAGQMVELCLVELDRPALALKFGQPALPADDVALLTAGAKPVAQVDGPTSLALAKRYEELASGARKPRKGAVLLRARSYLDHYLQNVEAAAGTAADRDAATAALAKITDELATLGVRTGGAGAGAGSGATSVARANPAAPSALPPSPASSQLDPETVALLQGKPQTDAFGNPIAPEETTVPPAAPAGGGDATAAPPAAPAVPDEQPARTAAAPSAPSVLPDDELYKGRKSIFDFGRD